MQRLLIALVLALCAPLCASAATLQMACSGAESDDCPVVMYFTADMETLIASYDGPTRPDGTAQRVDLAWCNPFSLAGNAPTQWDPASYSSYSCPTTGKMQPLRGELTRRQLAQASVVFETRRLQTYCHAYGAPPQCTSTPLFPARPDKVAVTCQGTTQGADCPVVVEARLDNERLIASFAQFDAAGTRRWVEHEWCGQQAGGWVPLGPRRCVLSGSFRVVDGELSLRTLAQGSIQFSTRKTEATCGFAGSAAGAGMRAVCRPQPVQQ